MPIETLGSSNAPKQQPPAPPQKDSIAKLLCEAARTLEGKPDDQRRSHERDCTIYSTLVERKALSAEDLDLAISEAHKRGCDVASVLMKRYKVAKQAVGDALSAFYKCPFVTLDGKVTVHKELIASVSTHYLLNNTWAPLWQEGSTLHIAIDDPHSSFKVQDIQQIFAGRPLRFYVALRDDILSFLKTVTKEPEAKAPEATMSTLLERIEADEGLAGEGRIEAEPEVDESDSVVVRLVNQIIVDAQKAGASDIHIEPYHDKDMIVRLRVDGECSVYQKIPRRYRRAIVARVKIMAGLDIAERRKPQDGKITFRMRDRELELRVATLPTVGENEDVVLRLLASGEPVPIDKLHLSPGNLRDLQLMLDMPYGIILCVGPTGSGKTTTLHSGLSYLNGPDRKIWTAEDPVEITQFGLRQVQIQPKIGLDFAAAMRAFLRADPDVIMVGEMRDHETAEIAVQASLTGHLVLSTLHTNGAPETVTRLLDMGLDPFNFADSLLGVLAQRLVRRLCSDCRKAYHPSRQEFDDLIAGYGPEACKLGIFYSDRFVLYEGAGCEACNHTGYKGRIGIHELLFASDDIRSLIRARAPASEILKSALWRGMRTLVQDGIVKCISGETDYSQVKAAAMK